MTTDTFDHLPTEIILAIIEDLPDLPSLRNLVHASPACLRVFSYNGAAIMERIMKTTPIPKQVQAIIRLVALLRSSACFSRAYPTLDALVTMCTSKDFASIPRPLGEITLSPRILRGILETMYQLWCLTHSCLQHYIDRCLALRPSRLLDPKFRYKPQEHGAPWRLRPEGRRVTPKNWGPPSWAEESRVSRAFWRVQLLYDLRKAASENRLGWSDQEVERLGTMGAWEFGVSPEVEKEQVMTVTEYVEELRKERRARKDLIASATSFWELFPFPEGEQGEIDLTATAACDDDTDTICQPFDLPWPIKKVVEPYGNRRKTWQSPNETDFLNRMTTGQIFHRNLTCLYASPLRYVSFDPFRRLGFAIWDRERLTKLKLLEHHPLPISFALAQRGDIFFRWRSILREEELEIHDRIAEERRREALKRLGLKDPLGE
ncbi:hypothetical protein VTN77DRAFT_5927 [Rasamsonia byssochlamydoides]|uniref:uncharacterized protein n=1 Tax=Rasamsonia byssochlamydoides TaxID=89139 RepID=UPI003741F91C